MENQQKGKRVFSMDLLRVIACYLVMNQHASEFYYIGDKGSVILGNNTFWVGIISSLGRISVPLFVMISGYFLIPMKGTTSAFFKKRVTRVVYPFVFWCIAFAVYYVFYRGDTLQQLGTNILHIPVNFGTEVGHLWYVYMLLGLYLLVPILTPWLQRCSKRELQGYLGLWAFTALLPYIHRLYPEVLGECFWNASPLLYYFTGFVGFLLLGYYIKVYGGWGITKSILLVAVGYAITAGLFCSRINSAANVPDLELSWNFCSLNVAIMAFGIFSLVHAITSSGTSCVGRTVTDISSRSYGMYLGHIMLLNFYHDLWGNLFASTLLEVPFLALCSFVTIYLIVRLLSYLPWSKYWLG
jgi:surface polysaccharide O-acyltransferase-like enzyme